MEIVVNILHIIISIALVAMVLLQSGRSAGISGSMLAVPRLSSAKIKVAVLMPY